MRIVIKIKSLFILLVLLFSFVESIFASFEISGNGARSRAMGLAYVGLADSPDVIFINCSGLAQIRQTSLNLFYSRPFGMKELSFGSMAAVLPTIVGHFGAGIVSYGNEIYREQTVMFAFSRSVRKKLYLGINFHYMKLQINGYGSNFSYSFDFGLLVKITENCKWGFTATNLNRAEIGAAQEQLPQSFSSGFSLSPVAGLILNMDIFKDIDFPAEFRAGIEYLIFNRIALRTGITTQPDNFCAGLGMMFSHFQIEYAMTTHADLGLTHQFGIQLQLKP